MYGYPILIERDGEFLIGTLPDWPECNPVGTTVEELLADATASIEEMVIARIEDREPLPPLKRDVKGPAVGLPLLTLLKLGVHLAMRSKGWRKIDLARAMEVDPKAVDRLLDLNHTSRLDQVEAAFRALGVYPEVRLPESFENPILAQQESSHHRAAGN